MGASTCSFDHPAVRRAKKAVAKRRAFLDRPRMFIQLENISLILVYVYIECFGQLELECLATLYLVTYAFLLRLPSEALPTARDDIGIASNEQSWLYFDVSLSWAICGQATCCC